MEIPSVDELSQNSETLKKQKHELITKIHHYNNTCKSFTHNNLSSELILELRLKGYKVSDAYWDDRYGVNIYQISWK